MRVLQKVVLIIVLIAGTITGFVVNAEACATAPLSSLAGTWQGSAILTLANGSTQTSETKDVFIIHSCDEFEVQVNYLNSLGVVARTLHLNAKLNGTGELFDVQGVSTEGTNSSPMTGTFQVGNFGMLLGRFSGALGNQRAYLSEVMDFRTAGQLTRTVQMSATHFGGNDIGIRIVRDLRTK